MERKQNKSQCKKVFIIVFLVVFFISIFIAIGGFVYNSILSVKYKVEYIKSSNDILVQTYYKGEKITFPDEPKKDGYQFLGWSLDEEENNILTHEIVVVEEMVLYAQWKEQSCKLKYEDDEVEITSNTKFMCENGSLIIINGNNTLEISLPEKQGYSFVGWQISDGSSSWEIDDFSISNVARDNLELIPLFESNYVNFVIEESEFYEIVCDVENVVDKNESLSFKVVLKDSVSNSNISVVSTCGFVKCEKIKDCYLVQIVGFENDFYVYITNITLNKYDITIVNEDKQNTIEQTYGENINLPTLTKEGYKLIGFRDSEGRYYSKQYVVVCDLTLFAVWEEEVYVVSFPKSNGMFIVQLNNDVITSSKNIEKKYNESIKFKIQLSNPYSNSKIKVYAISKGQNIDSVFNGEYYIFENISSNLEIIVDDVVLNSYSVSIDGVDYGDFCYGSWVYVDGDKITIKDINGGNTVSVGTLINDESFGGWICGDKVLTNCIVQDVVNEENEVVISGNYSKQVCRISFVANGGNLETFELIIVEGEKFDLPTPTRYGYKFAGWFVKLVEVNTVVDEELSVKYNGELSFSITLYAGWIK